MRKLAINGFGRIGRLALRNLLDDPNAEVVAINDLTDAKTLAHLFKYDSAHRSYAGEVSSEDGAIIVDGKRIACYSERDPANLPWANDGVEVVLECTGVFRTREQAGKHIDAGAKKVIISAPAKGGDVPAVVLGVNDDILKETDVVISNASCTTNCLAPVVKIIQDNWGIKEGFMNTIHAYTMDQRLHDAPHSDLRRARAAAENIVPTSTGAAKAVGKVIPTVAGKIEAIATRVPVITGSLVDLAVVLDVENMPTVEEVNAKFKEAAEGPMKGILKYEVAPIVSSDVVSDPHSSIFDSMLTKVHGGILKVVSWYDNEAGYAARMADLAMNL
ncbi:MAG TPA: type I glyceraldehyde-3-phosphate dehydrogenase [Flavobacteriales bacterium]|jgi:glyceraldehyde 3-phosphate dehydrogenase|nr:type I glyceraldehyde-3-phosphate dehydrogenase [Flavobacteriales bacterium]